MSTAMLSRSEWDKLETAKQVQEQISIRAKLSHEMVGSLYPSILADEVVDLLDIKKALSKWVLQLIEYHGYEERTIAHVERRSLELPPRYISRRNSLWVIHEQHRPTGMAQRATYREEGTDLRMFESLKEMMKWETWSDE